VSALLLLVVLAVAGAPLALRVCGPRAEVVALAPLLGAGYLAAAALVEVAVGGPPFALAGSALTVGALAPLTTVRKVRAGFAVAPRDGLLLTAPVLVLGWVLTTLERVQVSYDGRSIWLFHARMLVGGRQVFLAQAHLFAFSHPTTRRWCPPRWRSGGGSPARRTTGPGSSSSARSQPAPPCWPGWPWRGRWAAPAGSRRRPRRSASASCTACGGSTPATGSSTRCAPRSCSRRPCRACWGRRARLPWP